MVTAVRAEVGEQAAEWEWRSFLLLLRCGDRCEGCGRRFDVTAGVEPSRHHRRPRRMGGSRAPDVHSLSNLLMLCGGRMAGVHGCHGWYERNRSDAYQRGFLVEAGHNPATVPVVLFNHRRVLLDADSPFYTPAPDGPRWADHVPLPPP